LDDLGDFSAMNVSISQTSALSAVSGPTAASGNHSIEVTALAKAQRRSSAGFATSAVSLNNGNAFNLSLTVGTNAAQTLAIPADKATPGGVVSAINSANLGVQAQLVNTGDANTPYKIVVTGQTGANNAFTLTSYIAAGNSIDFATSLETAANAAFRVNGVSMTRASNNVTDAITGVTLNLRGLTSGTASLELVRDTSPVKTKLKDLVAAYNDVESVLSDATAKDSKIEGYGASLVGDSLVQSVRGQVRALFTGNSSTPGTQIVALRDLGISCLLYTSDAADE
jgi:flagellar hook-associated protein 2